MPDPALEIAGQFFASRRRGGLEHPGDLLAQTLRIRPDFFGLRLDRAAQRLEDFLFQPLGPDQGDRNGSQPDRADRDIGGFGGAAEGQAGSNGQQ